MAKSVKKAPAKKSTGKRTTIAPNGDKRYVKRDEKGQFKESDDVGRSLSRDIKQKAKSKVEPGYGDQGDQSRRKSATKKTSPKKASPKKVSAKKATPKKASARRR